MEDYSKRMATWFILKEGGFIPFMEAIEGHDENFSLQFANGWSDRMVTINGITFQVNEEVIAMATGLSTKGKKWRKVAKPPDETSMNGFFHEGEVPVRFEGVS